jgi:hypothetical protein
MRRILSYLDGKYLGRLWMRPSQCFSQPSNEGLNRSVVLFLCITSDPYERAL